MNIRDELLDLLEEAEGQVNNDLPSLEQIADYLIENGVTIRRWIPVTERPPEVVSTHKHRRYTSKKSARVLCVCAQKDGKRMVKEGYCEWYLGYPEPRWRIPGTIDSVTHWMPKPELPALHKEE